MQLKIAFIAAALVFPAVFATPSVAAEIVSAQPKQIEVNGTSLTYVELGSGEPVLFVHGMFGDYRVWTEQVRSFSAKYHAVAVSLRHFYPEKWDGKGADFSLAQHADDIAAFIVKLGLGKVHLIGHSRGGAVTLTVAKEHPELIRTLVLADSIGLQALITATPETRSLLAEAQAKRQELTKRLSAGDAEKGLREFTDYLSKPGAWDSRTAQQKQIALDNLTTAVTEPPANITCEDVVRFDFPIFTVTGEHSAAVFGLMFDGLRRCKGVAAPTVISNAGHSMFRDNPAEFDRMVLAFLDSNAALRR